MKILIATDGSGASRSVIEAACETIKKPEDAKVKIISVVEPVGPMGTEPFAISAEYYAQVNRAGREQANKTVEEAETKLKEICSNLAEVTSEVLLGNAGRAIVENADEWSADLIVVGSHGYGFWSRALLGSVSNSVVHHAPCSVLVVREREEGKS